MQPYNNTEPKLEQVRTMFDRVAPRYDTLNHLLSLGIDRYWRQSMMRMVRKGGALRIADLATGTGDMAVLMGRKIEGARITGVDISEGMLSVAEAKITKKRLNDKIDLVVAQAEELPFAAGELDAVTVVFGVRNFHNIAQSLNEMHRVLRSGGRVYVMEFSTPRNKIFGAFYRLYFHRVLPVVGGWISKDKQAYRYLPQSVDMFPSEERFLEMLSEHGFKDCSSVSFMTGVANVYLGQK